VPGKNVAVRIAAARKRKVAMGNQLTDLADPQRTCLGFTPPQLPIGREKIAPRLLIECHIFHNDIEAQSLADHLAGRCCEPVPQILFRQAQVDQQRGAVFVGHAREGRGKVAEFQNVGLRQRHRHSKMLDMRAHQAPPRPPSE